MNSVTKQVLEINRIALASLKAGMKRTGNCQLASVNLNESKAQLLNSICLLEAVINEEEK